MPRTSRRSRKSRGVKRSPPKKKLRSQEPDVIVSVGSGNNKQEFETYKFILSYASEYFDTMLSLPLRETETSQIELPDKDPEEWMIFYEFLDPATHANAEVTSTNALILAPWFHEYQMGDLLDQCDAIISRGTFIESFLNITLNPKYYKKVHYHGKYVVNSIWDPCHISNTQRTIENIEKILDFYNICEQCSLQKSLASVLREIGKVMRLAYDLLAKEPTLIERLTVIYETNKDDMTTANLLDGNARKFYDEISNQEERNWESSLFKSWIETKLELAMLKKKQNFGCGREVRNW